ncbi:MAG: transcription antitermination factor NusB [Gemmatales bacterium]|nr:transcription antitermination factor NusB [Gemmatales bacterium]MDW8387024.1 transcription antitermination factor NusB [Gemmatales bacterium]
MTRRSRAREVVLQLLYQHDHNPLVDPQVIRAFLEGRLKEPQLVRFAEGLYRGVLEHLSELDARLASVAENWTVERMAAVDRNVLRMGAYELLYCPETPRPVVIDEAIEIARRYGSADSPAFVNGVLDRLAEQRDKARSESSPEATTSSDG